MARVLVMARVSFVFSMIGRARVRDWLVTPLYVMTGCMHVILISCGAGHRLTPVLH